MFTFRPFWTTKSCQKHFWKLNFLVNFHKNMLLPRVHSNFTVFSEIFLVWQTQRASPFVSIERLVVQTSCDPGRDDGWPRRILHAPVPTSTGPTGRFLKNAKFLHLLRTTWPRQRQHGKLGCTFFSVFVSQKTNSFAFSDLWTETWKQKLLYMSQGST